MERPTHRTAPPATRATQDEGHDALAPQVDLRNTSPVGGKVHVEGGLGEVESHSGVKDFAEGLRRYFNSEPAVFLIGEEDPEVSL